MLFAMMYFTIFLIICSSCFVNGNFHSRSTSEEKTIFELGSQLASLGSPEIKIKRVDSQNIYHRQLLNIYVGWDIFIGKERSYLQLNVDEYGDLASTLDFNVYDVKGNFKLHPIQGRIIMEGKISSCDECFLHADIQTNVTSNRYQTKVDILFSNIHGYPHNGMFDSVPFIRLKDQKEIEATLKIVIPNNGRRSNDPLTIINRLRSSDYPPKNARVDFAFKVKGDIANPIHETNIRKPNYDSKFAPGTYLLSASAKITHDGPVTIRNLRSHEHKSVVRINMKDEIEYEDATLNVASIFEGIDEIVNIDFTLSGEAWRRMGDSDLFSLSMKNVNQGIEYGNLRAFFKTQDHFRIEFGMLGLTDSVNDLTTMSLNLNTTPTSTEIYLEGDEYSIPNQCSEFDNYTPTNDLRENNETEIDLEDENSTDSSLTPHLFPMFFGASDSTLQSDECLKYKIWEFIDHNDQKVTRWYKDFLQFFGEYVTGKYYYYPRERQNKSQVVEQIIYFIDNGYVIHNYFSTPSSNTFMGLAKDGPLVNIQMQLNQTMLADLQYHKSVEANLYLQLHDGLDRYSAKLTKTDAVDGDKPIIDATIYDSETAKTLSIIFNKLVPSMMKVTSLTRSNAESIMNINMASIWSYFNMLEQKSCPKSCKCQSPPRDLPGRRNVQGPGVAKGYCFHWCDPIGFCGVGEVAKTQGRDCRPCRMKFYGY